MPVDAVPIGDLFNDPKPAVPSCVASDEDLKRQRERQVELAPSVRRMERKEHELVIDFEPGFARRTLKELIEVERQCCPCFLFEFDENKRRLTVSVRDAEHLSAIDALAAMLGAYQITC